MVLYPSQPRGRNTSRIGPSALAICLLFFANLSRGTATSLNANTSGSAIIPVTTANSIPRDASFARTELLRLQTAPRLAVFIPEAPRVGLRAASGTHWTTGPLHRAAGILFAAEAEVFVWTGVGEEVWYFVWDCEGGGGAFFLLAEAGRGGVVVAEWRC